MWFRRQREPIVAKPRSQGTSPKRRERQAWPPDRDFRILSLDGGGTRGILPLAVLARLEETHLGGNSIAGYFDLVAGTSTGGVVALGLACGRTAAELLAIYIDKGGEVFPDLGWLATRFSRGMQYFLNRCDERKLEALAKSVLGDRQLWESRLRLCVPAAETRHFEPFIFKTPHHPDYRLDWKETMAHVAMSTSAAPAHFRPVRRSDGYVLIDGGVWANNPIMVGVADALACFDMPRERVRVLSLGCVKDEFEMTWGRRHLGGMWFWREIMFESMHVQSQNVVGQARLVLGHDRVLRIDAEPVRPKLEMCDWARCREILPQLASELFNMYGQRIASEFLVGPAERYQPCYAPTRPPKIPSSVDTVAGVHGADQRLRAAGPREQLST